jgi:membrane fusion protein, multidrug efflux system
MIKIKRKFIIIISIILAIAAIYYFFFSEKTVSVRKIETTKIKILKSVSADGTIEAENKADLSFGATGKILSMNVKKYQAVQAGQLLATLDQSSYFSTVQTYKDARDISLRDRDLFIEKYKNSESRDALGGENEYQISLRKVNEQVSQAQSAYNAQLADYKNLTIKAPFSGLIIQADKKPGETATLGTTIIKLVDLNSLYFEAFLDQEDFGLLKEGQQAELLLDSYENQTPISGSLAALPQVIEDGQSNFLIKIPFTLDGKNIAYGMSGEARIIVEETPTGVQALSFDTLFVDEDGKNSYVWSINNGKLEKKYITLGLEGDFYTEIKDDLSGVQIVMPVDTPKEDITGFKAKITENKK